MRVNIIKQECAKHTLTKRDVNKQHKMFRKNRKNKHNLFVLNIQDKHQDCYDNDQEYDYEQY
jgi:hypothetical protein